ncbi:hypothetical protein ACF0H5_021689 [Mactra antiquata]
MKMAFIGEAIYEDYLYKFTGKSRSILWGKGSPWRQKYFVLKRVGNKPVLEIFNKKPKTKNLPPKGKVELWPSFRVEKVTNMKNRAYVFQITTPDTTVCLSTDEQRSMDIFVFFLQIQTRLKDQIKEDFFVVHPENSEAQRRIGAKGTDCVLHISPYGLTLALQSNRSVLAQWPLKSIRSYESSEGGQILLEAGRVAPMGDGMYVFNTERRGDHEIYDLIDRYVLDALDQIPVSGLRGGSEEIEDYVIEAERLLSLTGVSAVTTENPDIRNILRENWSIDSHPQSSSRPRAVVHTRLTNSESMASLNSQSSVTTTQSVPTRFIHENGSSRNSPMVPRSVPAFQNSPKLPKRGPNQIQLNLNERPPAPTPSPLSSTPQNIPQRSNTQNAGSYLRMNPSVSRSSSNPDSPFSPTSADFVHPPSFREAMRQKSTSPIAENGPYDSDSYLLPSPGATSTPNNILPGNRLSVRDQYLTPMSMLEDQEPASGDQTSNNGNKYAPMHSVNRSPKTGKNLHGKQTGSPLNSDKMSSSPQHKVRSRRLRSASCEDLSDYLRSVVYDPISKSMNDLLDNSNEGDYIDPEPFPRLQSFSGVLESHYDHYPENYYNIEGLKGKIYDGPGLPVTELRKRFSRRSLSQIRRSVSNPNFIGSLSLEKLNLARMNIGITSSHKPESRTSSLIDILPEGLKKHISKDSSHRGSHSTLSSGHASKNSSRASSAHASPYNSLTRGNKSPKEDIIATTSVKGINITKRSRSFRRQKPIEHEHLYAKNHSHRPDHHTTVSNKGESQGGENSDSSANDVKQSDNNAASGFRGNTQKEIELNTSDSQKPEKIDSSLTKPLPKIAPKPKSKPTAGGGLKSEPKTAVTGF